MIIPKKNMVCDIGLTENATHANSHAELLPKKFKNMFNMNVYDVSFPMKEPKFLVPDMNYMKKVFSISGVGNPLIRFKRKLTYFLKFIRHGKIKLMFSKIKNKINKR